VSKPQKRSGGWRIRWIDADGKRKSETFATYDLARTALRHRENKAEEDEERRARFGTTALTVTEAGERFIKGRKREPHNTERRFEKRGDDHGRHFDRHIKPHLGDVRLCDLTPSTLREWISKLATTTTNRPGEKNKSGRTLSASTVRAIVTTLRQIAKANDVPLVVILTDSLKQKRRRSRPRALQSIDDVRALLEACTYKRGKGSADPRDGWFKVAAAIACYCGARLGEVASLRWRHVASETITLALSWEGPLKARYENDDEAERVVPLAPELAAILKAWRKVTKGKADDRIVLVAGKRPLHENLDDMAAKTRAACKRAGLTPLTFHSLRASYATIVADQGLPVSKLQALLGHADAATTAIYIRAESQHAAMDPRALLGGPSVDQARKANQENLN
jgi:integrase